MKFSIKFLQQFCALSSCSLLLYSCAGDGNYGECSTDSKVPIAEITTIAQLKASEAKQSSSTCTPLSYEDDAEVAIKTASRSSSTKTKIANYLKAATILDRLKDLYPEEPERLRAVAATYAAAAGLEDVLSLASNISGGGGLGLPDLAGSLYNKDETRSYLQLAADRISTKLQLDGAKDIDGILEGIYKSSLAALIVNDFLETLNGAEITADNIGEMSEEDAIAIVDNLANIENPQVKEALAEFDGADDLTDAEKKDLIAKAFASKE